MSEDESAQGAAATPQKSSKVLPMMLVMNTLLITGVLIFVLKRPSAHAEPPAKASAGEHAAAAEGEHGEKAAHGEKGAAGDEGEAGGGEDGTTLRLDAFIVQVRSAEGDRYAHITIEVAVGGEADKKPFESRMPRIRDAVIGYISDRTEDELRGSEGLSQLKEALSKKLNDIVPGHRVHGIFVTEFIIQ